MSNRRKSTAEFPRIVLSAGNFVKVREMATKSSGIAAEDFQLENPQAIC